MTRSRFLTSFVIAAFSSASLSTLKAEEAGSFKGETGLQLYSLREQSKVRGVPWMLDQVKSLGIKEVELAGTGSLTAEQFKAEVDSRGLKAVSSHFPYKRYKEDLDAVIRDAKALGLKYAGCAWIDHKSDFTEEACKDAIATFNRAGEALAKEGITFFYHCHGYEFQPHGDSNLFDLLMKETKPEFVSYQMDVLWVVYPGQDPVKLMKKYEGRWKLMHLKDLRKGVALGALTGHTDLINDVTLGTGQMDWPTILKTAQEIGIQHYFIEDESPSVMEQLPNSLTYMKSVKW